MICRIACLILLPLPALAATAPALPGAPSPWLSLLQVVLALALVLALVLACAYLLRRFGGGALGASRYLRVVGGVMVGQKERVVIVESGDDWLVLGVTAHGVSLLDKRPRPADAPPLPEARFPDGFARIMKAALDKARPPTA